MIEYKLCFKCNEMKHINDFHKNKTSYDGFDKYCKQCTTPSQTKQKHNNKMRDFHLTSMLFTLFIGTLGIITKTDFLAYGGMLFCMFFSVCTITTVLSGGTK